MAIISEKHFVPEETKAIAKRVISENWKQYTKQYMIAFALLILVAATTAYTAYIVKNITNDVFVKQDINAAYLIAISIFGVFTLRGFATYGYQYTLAKIGNSIGAIYQRRIYDQMLNLGIKFHKSNRSTYVIGQINQNIAGMRNMMNDIVIVFARDLFTLIGLIFVMVYQDWLMSVLSLTVMPVIAYVMSRYVKRIRKIAREEVDLNSKVHTSLIESSQGMDILKSFTMEEQMTKKVHDLTEAARDRSDKIARLNAKTKPPTEILAGFAIASVVAFGGYRVANEGHDPGELFSFLTAAMLAYDPARKLASFRVKIERSMVNARMLYEILDMPRRQTDKPDAGALKLEHGKIEFKDVNFAYDEDNNSVINGISITAEPSQTIALVGPSGGGKSTLMALAQRFYDLSSGQILIDGQDITDVTIHSLRTQIAYVSQQPIMFEGSIMENIRFGKPDASDEDVFEAAKRAQAHDFILEQPDKYHTSVGELGSNLSGGQRQRISIARAFLRDAPILLLDEATSALDNESEQLVQQAIDTLVKGRTTIVIAHRLSTIKNADKIFVIEDGKVTQSGTHASLTRNKKGKYARLYKLGSVDDEAEPENVE